VGYLPAPPVEAPPPVEVPAPPLGLTLEPARPLLGLLVPGPPGAADCPDVDGAPELVPAAPAFIPAPPMGLAALGCWVPPA
jgi:hypothetical protein